ncbi:hypothetical protein LCGC14_0259240 [marine sediment metagenome]|uniref:Uncharacterized protein n=1 Tax=marine sediment metagenome TaxID=412755 RepID=A0A0F9U789_9ZZZZ
MDKLDALIAKPRPAPCPCFSCDGRRAKFPRDNPRFCTQRCAVDWALGMTESYYYDHSVPEWTE